MQHEHVTRKSFACVSRLFGTHAVRRPSSWRSHCGSPGRRRWQLCRWYDSDMCPLRLWVLAKVHSSLVQCVDRVVLADAYILPDPPFGAPLPHDDAPGLARLPVRELDAKALCVGAFRVFGRTTRLLCSPSHLLPHTRPCTAGRRLAPWEIPGQCPSLRSHNAYCHRSRH